MITLSDITASMPRRKEEQVLTDLGNKQKDKEKLCFSLFWEGEESEYCFICCIPLLSIYIFINQVHKITIPKVL